jgi:hypothetical protein
MGDGSARQDRNEPLALQGHGSEEVQNLFRLVGTNAKEDQIGFGNQSLQRCSSDPKLLFVIVDFAGIASGKEDLGAWNEPGSLKRAVDDLRHMAESEKSEVAGVNFHELYYRKKRGCLTIGFATTGSL